MKYILLIIAVTSCFGTLRAQTELNISFDTEVKLSGNINLVLNDMDLDNEGSLGNNGTSSVIFSGSTNSKIYSFDDVEFYNLIINKSAGGKLELDTDILVENNIEMNQGIFDIKGYLVTLDGGQIIDENASNYITSTSNGRISLITVLNAPDQENPGNLGIEITSVANLGQTSIRRGHQEQTSNGGGKSILRYYDVNPVNNSGLNATFRLYYNDAELNGIPEAELEPWRSTDGGDTWELQEGSLLNTTNNWVQLSGVDAFSRWTLASATTATLPVELSFFRGQVQDNNNLLEWETLTEENVDRFELQKLRDTEWRSIASIEAAHFSLVPQFYDYEDSDIENEEYYRLQIIDYDGQIEYSEVIHLQRIEKPVDKLSVFPNPVQDVLHIEQADTFDALYLLNATGSFIRQFPKPLSLVNLSEFPGGIYFLKAQKGQEFYMQKIVKQ